MPALNDLAAFQDAFAGALIGEPAKLTPWLAPDETPPGLAVYRGSTTSGMIDALEANHPTVLQIVGRDWFRAAAGRFAAEHPPTEPSLLAYGAAFGAWLEHFAPSADLPYLPGIARLDRLWTEALFAADAPVLNACDFAAIPPARLPFLRVCVHPAVRWAVFDQGLPGLWLASRAGESELEIEDTPQAMLVTRPATGIETRLIAPAATTFLKACVGGKHLHRATADTLARHTEAEVSRIFAGLIGAGAFTALR